MGEMIQKAPFGEPCARCGECCTALEVGENGVMKCGLITRPHFYIGLAWSKEDCAKFDEFLGELAAKYLGIGKGCGNLQSELDQQSVQP